jgi:uncharacterized Zn-finger protein
MGRACPAAGVFHPGSHFRYLAPVSATLRVHEIYLSIQGESTYAGLPCVFIRLSGCNLRCSYCDTAYAFVGGRRMSVSEILAVVEQLAAPYAGRRDPQDGPRCSPRFATRASPRSSKRAAPWTSAASTRGLGESWT